MASSYWTEFAVSSILAGAILTSGCAPKSTLPYFGKVSDFTLTDQTGAAFSSTQLKNQVWVADFIYTNCPGPCPRMSSQMHQVQTALKDFNGVKFVSFTVDPARDTPPVLAAYAQHFEADPSRWYFLTGPIDKLSFLSSKVFMLGNVDGTLEHSTRFALVDQKGAIRGFYVSSDPDAIPNLLADAQALLLGKG